MQKVAAERPALSRRQDRYLLIECWDGALSLAWPSFAGSAPFAPLRCHRHPISLRRRACYRLLLSHRPKRRQEAAQFAVAAHERGDAGLSELSDAV